MNELSEIFKAAHDGDCITLENSFTNTSISSKTTYYYKVKAISSNTDANSVFSSVVSKKTR